jgi:diacylglycerol kinase family enzyme
MPANEEILHIGGGDGTLFHAINAPDYRGQPIELAPAGRGNALARDLARRADSSSFIAIDLIETTIYPESGDSYVRLCASSVGFGYPSELTRKAGSLRLFGRLSYAAAGLLTLPKTIRPEIAYDAAAPESRPVRGILINNTRHVGGFTAIREAQVDDGIIDVLELNAGYISQTVHNLSEVTGLGLWRPARHIRMRQATVRADGPSLLMLDGELVAGIAAVELKVLPGALRIRLAQSRSV